MIYHMATIVILCYIVIYYRQPSVCVCLTSLNTDILSLNKLWVIDASWPTLTWSSGEAFDRHGRWVLWTPTHRHPAHEAGGPRLSGLHHRSSGDRGQGGLARLPRARGLTGLARLSVGVVGLDGVRDWVRRLPGRLAGTVGLAGDDEGDVDLGDVVIYPGPGLGRLRQRTTRPLWPQGHS